MTRCVTAIFLLLSTVFLSAEVGADTVEPTERVTNYVNVRDQPRGAPARIIGRLNKGESAVFLDAIPYYFKVQLSNGRVGFVGKSWTKRIAQSGERLVPNTGSLEVHFIDVGQGDATMIKCPDGQTILVDAGSLGGNVEPDAVRDYIIRQLDQNHLGLDVLVVTHPDTDHYNLLRDVLDDISIGHIYRVGKKADYNNPTIWNWLSHAAGRNVSTLSAGVFDRASHPNNVMSCGDADVWIMSAGISSSKSRKNAMSIVLMVKYGTFETVLTGDATFATEDVIMGRYSKDWLDADVLKIGHHGSSTTSTQNSWADTVKPKLAIASAARSNSYNHPRATVIKRLEPHTDTAPEHPIRYGNKTGSSTRFVDDAGYREAIYSTATSGTIVVTSTGRGFSVRTNVK
jgi:competence protein ComEC